jgi:N-methylhydantoinase B
VLRDIAWRKVSVSGARDDYGVVVNDDGTADGDATEALRQEIRAARTGEEPFFDRGPGYATLSGGATFNEFDVL